MFDGWTDVFGAVGVKENAICCWLDIPICWAKEFSGMPSIDMYILADCNLCYLISLGFLSTQFKKIFFFFSFSLSSCNFNRFASNSAILLTPPAKFLLEHIHEKSFQDYPEWSNPIIFRIILKISKKLVVNEEWSNQAREKKRTSDMW